MEKSNPVCAFCGINRAYNLHHDKPICVECLANCMPKSPDPQLVTTTPDTQIHYKDGSLYVEINGVEYAIPSSNTAPTAEHCVINIMDYDFDLKIDDKDLGAYVDFNTKEIVIGNNRHADVRQEYLVHELIEAGLTILDKRYANPKYSIRSDSYIFVFDHNDLTKLAQIISDALVKGLPYVSQPL